MLPKGFIVGQVIKNEAHGAESCDASYLIAKSFRTETLIHVPSTWQMFNL